MNKRHHFTRRINLIAASCLIGVLMVCFPAFAGADQSAVEIDWFNLGMGLFGGLALFLAGLDMLSEGLKKAAGNSLRTLLSKMTSNRLLGAITGAFITAVLNSKKEAIRDLSEELLARESRRLGSDQKEMLESARIEISLIDKMRRIHRLARRIAKIASSP